MHLRTEPNAQERLAQDDPTGETRPEDRRRKFRFSEGTGAPGPRFLEPILT